MAKSAAFKLPKKIAGIKVPKALRKSAAIGEFLNSPTGRLILAEILMAAAAALRNYKPVSEAVHKAADTAGKAGSEATSAAKDVVRSAAGGLADLAAGVTRQIVPASADRDESEAKPGKKGRAKSDKSPRPSAH